MDDKKTDQPKEPKRGVIQYRTKALAKDAKWSLWFQRELNGVDSEDLMDQFYNRRTWPAMTGMVEVKGITWDA